MHVIIFEFIINISEEFSGKSSITKMDSIKAFAQFRFLHKFIFMLFYSQ